MGSIESNLRFFNYRRRIKGEQIVSLLWYKEYIANCEKDCEGRVNPNINVLKRNPEYDLYLKHKREKKLTISFEEWMEERKDCPKDKNGKINRSIKRKNT